MPSSIVPQGMGWCILKGGETNIKEKKNSYRTHLCLKNTHWQAYKDNCVLMWTLWNLWLWLYIQPFLNKSVHWLHMCGTPFSTDDKAKGSHKVSLRNWKCIGSNVDKTDCIKPSWVTPFFFSIRRLGQVLSQCRDYIHQIGTLSDLYECHRVENTDFCMYSLGRYTYSAVKNTNVSGKVIHKD